jgi:hypothetical protein
MSDSTMRYVSRFGRRVARPTYPMGEVATVTRNGRRSPR